MRQRQQSATARPAHPLMGARKAEQFLGISRTLLHKLAQQKRLPGHIVDKPGARRWQFKRSDVVALKASGSYIRHRQRPRLQRELWREHYGAIPDGFTPVFRDGDKTNTARENLCLLPLRRYWKHLEHRRSRRRELWRITWTKEQNARLRREYPTRPAIELAREFNVSLATLRRQVQRLKLRKDVHFFREQASRANRLPLGTERVHEHANTVWVKVSFDGKEKQQWRPKHHVAWEKANGRKVPTGYRVVFKDGNKRNFDAGNLELATREEISAVAFAKFLSAPKSLQRAIKITSKLRREVERQRRGEPAVNSRRARRRPAGKPRRWTPQMDAMLCDRYPSDPLPELLAALGVSRAALRNRARRLQVRRLPETMIAEARAMASVKKAHDLATGD